MNIIFDVGHPGHVHLFKNVMLNFEKRGYEILVVIRERENTVKPLVKKLELNYTEIHPNVPGILGKAITMIKNDLSLLNISKKFNPDLFISMTSPYSAQVSSIIGKPHITFTDTEDARLILNLTIPFTDVVITEKSYMGKVPNKKHISLPTWRPLAYLHPKYFTPNSEVPDMLGVSKDDKYFIMRFSAWDASHDWRIQRDFGWEERYKMVKMLEKEGYVFITSELPLPAKLEKYKLKTPPHLFHDVLAFSSGYVGEGHMSAREAVCLGIPSILISPRAELESVIMDLVNNGYIMLFHNYSALQSKNFNELFKFRKDRVINEIGNLVDFNKFLMWFIENYPESMEEYRHDLEKVISKFKFGNTE